MNWNDYKAEKLKNPKFKQAYDELEEEFNFLNEKLSAENKKIPEKKFYKQSKEKYFEQVATL